MQCFKLPEPICEDIDSLCAGFWWGDKEDQRRMHWKKWSKICMPKEWGGMGFRSLRSFNKALLAKQLWRLITRPQSPVARVFRARYFKNGEIMNAQVKQGASYIWRSLAWSRQLIQKGHRWRVGDGADIQLFEDVWVVKPAGGQIMEKESIRQHDMRVSEIINPNGEWDQNKIEAIL